VDDGRRARAAGGQELLPAGVTGAVGRFERGDTVSIIGPDGAEVARGICAYSDGDAARIIGASRPRSRRCWIRGATKSCTATTWFSSEPLEMRYELRRDCHASAPPDSVPDLMRAIGRDAGRSLVLAAADTDQKIAP